MCLTIFHTSHKLTETASFFQMTTLFLPLQNGGVPSKMTHSERVHSPLAHCCLGFCFLVSHYQVGIKKLWFDVCGFGCTTHQAYKKETTLRKSNVYYKQLHKFSVRWVNSYLSIDPSLPFSISAHRLYTKGDNLDVLFQMRFSCCFLLWRKGAHFKLVLSQSFCVSLKFNGNNFVQGVYGKYISLQVSEPSNSSTQHKKMVLPSLNISQENIKTKKGFQNRKKN